MFNIKETIINIYDDEEEEEKPKRPNNYKPKRKKINKNKKILFI